MEPGSARGQWARPAPAPCHLHPSSVPLHTNSNMHTLPLFLTWPISLEHWLTAPPPPHHLLCVCLSVCLSLNHPTSFSLTHTHTHTHTHTLACSSSSPARCEDDCLWTDICDTGRMCWINCVCIGIDPANRHSGNPLFHDHNSRRGH